MLEFILDAIFVLDLVPSEWPRDQRRNMAIAIVVMAAIMIGLTFWLKRSAASAT